MSDDTHYTDGIEQYLKEGEMIYICRGCGQRFIATDVDGECSGFGNHGPYNEHADETINRRKDDTVTGWEDE